MLRIAAFLVFASGGISDSERSVIDKIGVAFNLADSDVESVIEEAREAIAEAKSE